MSAAERKAPAPTRDDLEAAIENAIDMLNALDGEPDFEPEETDHSGNEDDFDSVGRGLQPARDHALMVDDEPDADGEPSLGSLEDHEMWASGGVSDLEGDEHDGREPDVHDEPSLGATATFSQVKWGTLGQCPWFGHNDAEQDAGEMREQDADFEIDGGDAREDGDGECEAWVQPVHTPLFHRDGIQVAWSQGARVDVKDAAE